ncbi:hypothetical protein MAPG_08209 [Magnaporthiopsis poae ATCC 64411]|uniref:Uncharacterized protein n=1 Tax=Magnaporthiopsis poae (strain ATCC 64411 / 73-15) TaxID=644358 RepID=A0A0C4E6R3_MAGP6|nr:hypothetical protein MAPG_08209 [Magnaporthiopsis poae ATCC 64411]
MLALQSCSRPEEGLDEQEPEITPLPRRVPRSVTMCSRDAVAKATEGRVTKKCRKPLPLRLIVLRRYWLRQLRELSDAEQDTSPNAFLVASPSTDHDSHDADDNDGDDDGGRDHQDYHNDWRAQNVDDGALLASLQHSRVDPRALSLQELGLLGEPTPIRRLKARLGSGEHIYSEFSTFTGSHNPKVVYVSTPGGYEKHSAEVTAFLNNPQADPAPTMFVELLAHKYASREPTVIITTKGLYRWLDIFLYEPAKGVREGLVVEDQKSDATGEIADCDEPPKLVKRTRIPWKMGVRVQLQKSLRESRELVWGNQRGGHYN